MLIRETSDFHVEFWSKKELEPTLEAVLPSLPTDRDTVLAICGDLGTFNHYDRSIVSVLAILAERFREVLYVYGNHEWYKSNVWGCESQFWQDKSLPENVNILDDGCRIIDDVVFIGATLWTDFNRGNASAIYAAATGMNDFNLIYTGYSAEVHPNSLGMRSVLTPQQTIERHLKSKEFIFDACRQFQENKRVVLTHHCPSIQSVDRRYAGQLLNYAFFRELKNEIDCCGPDLWFHGHTHHSFNYTIGRTRVICNPFGYIDTMDQNQNYNPALVEEL